MTTTQTTGTTETQRRFATLFREKKELDDRLTEVKKELDALQEPMLNYFADAGIESVKVDGVTLYIHSQLWANTKEGSTPEQACAALKAGGLESFVNERFNTQTLSAYARELERKGESLPEVALEHVAVQAKIEIRGRRS